MKKSANQLAFRGIVVQAEEEQKGSQANANYSGSTNTTKVEFLPCLFQNSVDESNKAIYFDTIVRDAEPSHVPKGMADQLPFQQVSLHGRRMIGLERDLPAGYQGYVFHRAGDQDSGMQMMPSFEKTKLSKLGEFTKTTEWRKDQWQAQDDSYARSLQSYLECSAILNMED